MEILICGSHSFPDISFQVDPNHGLAIACKNNFVLNYEGQETNITWKDLIEKTEPSILGYDEVTRPWPMNRWKQGWGRLKEKLGKIPGSKGERLFLEAYFEASEKKLFSKEPRAAMDVVDRPALIPQVWVNWIHFDSKDKDRAQRTREEPFRVDFIMFHDKRKLVIEIDGTSHFSEILDVDPETGRIQYGPSLKKYTEHLKKDRWLRGRGWEVWRFSDEEILDEDFGVSGILAEMKCYGLFP